MRDAFKSLENAAQGSKNDLPETLDALKYNAAGLVPAIAQDAKSGAVLMLAWMNRESIEATLASGRVTYFSRSRNELWRKGDTSGHIQTLKQMNIDCDGDTLLLQVDQTGAACHTHRKNCFYLEVDQNSQSVVVTNDAGTSEQDR